MSKLQRNKTMKQLLDTFGQWGFFALHTILLLLAAFLVGLEIECPVIPWIVWKAAGVIGIYLWAFIGKRALLAEMFPTSVARFFAYMKEHVNTEDE